MNDVVRPGTVGLLIDIECSRVRNSLWMYLTSFVATRIGIELVAVQRKLFDRVVEGLQLYSAKTFHGTLSPRIYKGGQGSPPNDQHLRQYKQPHRMWGITQLAARTCLNLCVSCTTEFQSSRSLPTNLTAKGIPEQAWR